MTAMRAPTVDTAVHPVDFRRPSRIGRDAIVVLENRHDAFARRLATVWSGPAHSAVEVEHVATDQLSMDDFARSLPVPTALGTVRVDRLATTMWVDIDLPLALVLVERILGGPGDPDRAQVARRPTDLESTLIAHDVLQPVVESLDTALGELDGEPANLTGFDTTAQTLQLGPHAELLLLLTFRVEIRGDLPAQGLLTLAYPVTPLVNRLDDLIRASGGETDPEHDPSTSPIRSRLLDATIDVHVRLATSALPASTLARLEAGDVLRLDHRAVEPAQLVVDGDVVGTAHVGRRGRRLAVQVATFRPAAPADSAPTEAGSRERPGGAEVPVESPVPTPGAGRVDTHL